MTFGERFQQLDRTGFDPMALAIAFDHEVQPEAVVLRPLHIDDGYRLAQYLGLKRKLQLVANHR